MNAPLHPLALRAFTQGWKPKHRMTVSEWSDAHRMLAQEGSSRPGNWRTSTHPLLREIGDQLSEHSRAQLVVFMKPTQFGGTEIGVNWLGYIMDHAKGPTAVVMPTERSLNKWMAQKFVPMVDSTPRVNSVLSKRSNNGSDSNAQFKKFTGGLLYMIYAGSTAELKNISLRYVDADELDEWPRETPQGAPWDLLQNRLDNFPDRKVYASSTPTLEGASLIKELHDGGDQRQYWVPCPHCGELQVLKWGNLKWSKHPTTGAITDVWYACGENGCMIEEHYKSVMLPELGHGGQARWIAQVPDAPYPSYHANALYSPIGLGRSWAELAKLWIDAQGDRAKHMVFVNTRLAETYRDHNSDIKANLLEQRAEPYALRTVPPGCLVITVGVDVQSGANARLEVQVVGHGKGKRHWTLDYHVIPGNPSGDEVWSALADYVNNIRFRNAHGKELISEACAIDTGGHHTHDVYAFVRGGVTITENGKEVTKKVRRPMACKGASTPGRQILGKPSAQDVNWRGQSIKRGVMLYLIGADTAKHYLYGLLNDDADKPADERKVRFSDQLEISYYDGLVAETFNPRKNKWEIKKGKRNEPLDTWGLALAASHHPELYLHKYKAADWDRRAAMLEPVQVVDERGQAVEVPAPQQQGPSVIGGRISLGNGGRFGKR
jgi:phage terminase large subunit GpA-like protein